MCARVFREHFALALLDVAYRSSSLTFVEHVTDSGAIVWLKRDGNQISSQPECVLASHPNPLASNGYLCVVRYEM